MNNWNNIEEDGKVKKKKESHLKTSTPVHQISHMYM